MHACKGVKNKMPECCLSSFCLSKTDSLQCLKRADRRAEHQKSGFCGRCRQNLVPAPEIAPYCAQPMSIYVSHHVPTSHTCVQSCMHEYIQNMVRIRHVCEQCPYKISRIKSKRVNKEQTLGRKRGTSQDAGEAHTKSQRKRARAHTSTNRHAR